MSYSMLEPEWDPICECKYDPVHDRMDRDNCFFHCDMEDDTEEDQQPEEPQAPPKKPPTIAKSPGETAA